MQCSQLLAGSLGIAALLSIAGTSPSTGTRAACSVLSLAEVRAIVGTPVDIYAPGSSDPKVSGATTISNCTYTLDTPKAHSARLTLMWASSAKLVETNDYYVKRHKELSRIKGDVLVLASVTSVNGEGRLEFIEAESQLLMAAALKKL